ncbi:hypothetical protein PM082_023762 [Marasmius tenuissimus]|nr:hypothetical protein PM082_023762 [Marasmius tenuissimus]
MNRHLLSPRRKVIDERKEVVAEHYTEELRKCNGPRRVQDDALGARNGDGGVADEELGSTKRVRISKTERSMPPSPTH